MCFILNDLKCYECTALSTLGIIFQMRRKKGNEKITEKKTFQVIKQGFIYLFSSL